MYCACVHYIHIFIYWFMYVCEASCVHIQVHVCTHFLSTNSWTEHKDHTSQNLRTYSTWHTGSWLLTMSVYHLSCIVCHLLPVLVHVEVCTSTGITVPGVYTYMYVQVLVVEIHDNVHTCTVPVHIITVHDKKNTIVILFFLFCICIHTCIAW